MGVAASAHSNAALKRLLTLSIIALSRKLIEPRVFQNDELEQFSNKDVIQSFNDLCLKNNPSWLLMPQNK